MTTSLDIPETKLLAKTVARGIENLRRLPGVGLDDPQSSWLMHFVRWERLQDALQGAWSLDQAFSQGGNSEALATLAQAVALVDYYVETLADTLNGEGAHYAQKYYTGGHGKVLASTAQVYGGVREAGGGAFEANLKSLESQLVVALAEERHDYALEIAPIANAPDSRTLRTLLKMEVAEEITDQAREWVRIRGLEERVEVGEPGPGYVSVRCSPDLAQQLWRDLGAVAEVRQLDSPSASQAAGRG